MKVRREKKVQVSVSFSPWLLTKSLLPTIWICISYSFMIAKPLTFTLRNIWPSLSGLPLGNVHKWCQIFFVIFDPFPLSLMSDFYLLISKFWDHFRTLPSIKLDIIYGCSLAVLLFHCCQLMAGGKAGVNYFYFYLQFPRRKIQGLWPKSRFFRYLWVESVKKIIIFHRAQSFSSFVAQRKYQVSWQSF